MMDQKPQMRWRFLKSVAYSALALGIGFAVSHGLTLLKKPPPLREPVSRVYNVEVFKVECHDLREIVRAFGTSRADREVVLSAQVAGEVTEIHQQLRIGQRVRAHKLSSDKSADGYAGDLLLRIDPTTYQARVDQGRTHLAEDRAELERIQQEELNLQRLHKTIAADFEDSKREFDKSSQLRKQGVNTDSDLRRAQMDLRQHEKTLVQSSNDLDLLPARRALLQKKVESHEADLKLAEIELARTSIRPSFDGSLSAVQVEIGQYVRVGDPLLTITDDSIVEVPLSVTLDDYTKLIPDVVARKYPAVELAENETAAARWKGHVVRMSPKADEQTRTAMVYVWVDNSQQTAPLLPGMFVQARIEGPVVRQVKAVPRDAVLNGKAIVDRNGAAQERSVTIHHTLQNLAIVEDGLDAGDCLVLTNLDVIYDGAKLHSSVTRTLQDEITSQRRQPVRLIDASSSPLTEAGQNRPNQ